MSSNIGLDFIKENGVLAPTYRIEVNGIEFGENIYRNILEIVYESSEDAIDKLEMTFQNPEFRLSELRMFLPGNELSLWVGYNGQVQFLGRGIIYHHKVFFPNDGVSTLEVKAYPKSFQMTEKRPLIKKKGERNAKRKRPFVFPKSSLDKVFEHIADDWEFEKDIDPCRIKNPVNQPRTMSDYDFCTRLSNLAGFYFWVNADEKGRWTLYFKDPKSLVNEQEDIYMFRYNAGNKTTLFEFEPEMVLTKQYTKIRAEYTKPDGSTLKAYFEEDKYSNKWDLKAEELDEEILSSVASGTQVKVYLDDMSFMVPFANSVKTDVDLQAYVDRWVKRNREEFIMGNGKLIGVPNLRARQSHQIEGLGKIYDGNWHFMTVRHRITESDGYTCEFDARREF